MYQGGMSDAVLLGSGCLRQPGSRACQRATTCRASSSIVLPCKRRGACAQELFLVFFEVWCGQQQYSDAYVPQKEQR